MQTTLRPSLETGKTLISLFVRDFGCQASIEFSFFEDFSKQNIDGEKTGQRCRQLGST